MQNGLFPHFSQMKDDDSRFSLKMSSSKKEYANEDVKPLPDAVWLKARNSTDQGDEKAKNPFLLPADVDIFKKRETDAVISQQERVFYRSLPTQMKTTFLSRLRHRSTPRRSVMEDILPETETSRRNRMTWAALGKKGHRPEESVENYLIKQREAFLVQYSLAVKKETIQNLQERIELEQHRISQWDKQLQEDAIAFEKFIKEHDQNTVEVVNRAEKETMLRTEKTAEIKNAIAQMMEIKSDISKYQETLQEYLTCKKFLMTVAAPEWSKEPYQIREQRGEVHIKEKMKGSASFEAVGKSDSRTGKVSQMKKLGKCSRRQKIPQERQSSAILVANEEMDFDFSDSDEDPALHFSDPNEMLSVLTELEEQTLSYIQNFQETEEAMDDIQKTVQQTQDKMINEIQLLQQQMKIMQTTIQREREKASELELKAKIFSYGEYKADKQDHMLNLLHKKVKEVYRACGGELDSNLSTLHMLANIEYKVVDALDRLESMPSDKVDLVRSLRDKEKRIRLREEKAQLKKYYQEERLKLAMERALSDSKKRTGKKLMPRSQPLVSKKKDKDRAMTTREQQEHLYFFT